MYLFDMELLTVHYLHIIVPYISAPHTTFQSEEQNQQQQLQMQQNVQAAQQQALSGASSNIPSRPTYQQPHNPLSNVIHDHNSQKTGIGSSEKEKSVFRCPDCSKSFKHASGK